MAGEQGTKTKVFLAQSLRQPRDPLFQALRRAIRSAVPGAEIFLIDESKRPGRLSEEFQEAVRNSALVIADVSDSNPNVMYEIGYATSAGTPVLMIASSSAAIPFDVGENRLLVYNSERPVDEFEDTLQSWIRRALDDPNWLRVRRTVSGQPSAFISYSHVDAAFLDRLLVHLRPLEKKGLLDIWVDTRLKAGDRWKAEIEAALSQATIAVLLVSADFLAS